MVGIGGSGMSGLAMMLLRKGAHVSGTDRIASSVLDRLVTAGARVSTDQRAERIPEDAQVVVASAAIPASHPEMLEAQRRELPVIKYAELLGALMAQQHGIAISGTHGKSTTTAWLAFTLRSANLDPSFVVGAAVPQLEGGSGVGSGPHFVAEACEYDRSFLNLHPRAIAILNVEEDHLDCYENLAAISESFSQFGQLVPDDGYVIVNGQDPNCCAIADGLPIAVETFGNGEQDDWRATHVTLVDGRYRICITHHGRELGEAHLGLPGQHNISNALAVCALAMHAGVPWEDVRTALAEFRGADRRLQVRSEIDDITIVDDYAHHPTEIRATLAAARERFAPKTLWCIFQPHQHSRTRFLLSDFARSFQQADQVIIPRIYFVRDSERERQAVCAGDLVEQICANGGQAVHVAEFDSIVDLLVEKLRPGDLALTMGAGDIWKVADVLVQRLRDRRSQ